MDIIMWLIIGAVFLAIGAVFLAIGAPILFYEKEVTVIERTKLISKILCQFFVVFVVQDLIYAILTESFHNDITKKNEHLIGVFYNNPLENEWFWLILIVSLTFYCSQVYKTRCRIKRDIKNNDLIEKINPIKGLEKLLELKEPNIDELKKKQQEVKDFIENLEVRFNELSSQVDKRCSEAESSQPNKS